MILMVGCAREEFINGLFYMYRGGIDYRSPSADFLCPVRNPEIGTNHVLKMEQPQ